MRKIRSPFFCSLLLLLPACRSTTEESPHNSSSQAHSDHSKLRSALHAGQELPIPLLLDLLFQEHSYTRSFGPHELRYKAHFSLKPTTPPLSPPPVGQAHATAQELTDMLLLEWTSPANAPPRFRLEQHNDKDAGREIRLIEDKIYSKIAHRSWFERTLDSPLHELWLTDAQRCVADIIAFASPQLQLDAGEERTHQGREAIRYTLSRATQADPSVLPDPRVADTPHNAWRKKMKIEAIQGELILERSTGLWLDATVQVDFSFTNEAGDALLGQSLLDAQLRFYETNAPSISPPSQVKALPERLRPELEVKSLLKGLEGI